MAMLSQPDIRTCTRQHGSGHRRMRIVLRIVCIGALQVGVSAALLALRFGTAVSQIRPSNPA